MDMADHDEIRGVMERGRILSVNLEMTLLVGQEPTPVLPVQDAIELAGDRAGYLAEGPEEGPALHHGLPAPGHQAVAVDQPEPEPMDGHVVGLGDDPGAQLAS